MDNSLLKGINSINSYPKIIPPTVKPIRNEHLADYQFEVIKDSITQFEKYLDAKHEIALKLTHVGQSITLNITELSYSNPCLIHYYGYVNGQFAELIQHVTQINFLMVSVPKSDPEKPARRIGFTADES